MVLPDAFPLYRGDFFGKKGPGIGKQGQFMV